MFFDFMFINNWLYDLYSNKDYLYISTRGTICNNWISIINIIFIAILICNYYKVSLLIISIICQIIISLLTIGSLQFADMLSNKIIKGINLLIEQQGEANRGIETINRQLGVETQTEGIQTQPGGIQTLNTRLGSVERQMRGIQTLNTRLGSVETQIEGIQTLNMRMLRISEIQMEGIQNLNTRLGNVETRLGTQTEGIARIEQMMQELTSR